MHQLIQLFWDICRLQKTPQDIPYSEGLLWILLVFGVGLAGVNLSLSVPELDLVTVMMIVVLHFLLFFGGLAVLMRFMGYTNRVNQSLTSLVGCGVLIGLIALPLLIIIKITDDTSGMVAVLVLFLNIWELVVTAHIFRHALSINLLLAIVLTLGYFLLSILLVGQFVPQLEP